MRLAWDSHTKHLPLIAYTFPTELPGPEWILCWEVCPVDSSFGRELAIRAMVSEFKSQPKHIFTHMKKALLIWIIYEADDCVSSN